MDIRHLRTFVAVAESMSFSKAAEQLNLSQPPVSLQIKHLEEELGVKLIERGGKREITLTPAGKVFLTGARNTMQALDRARRSTLLFAQGRSGQINIGYTDDFIFSPLPDAITAFYAKYSDVSINFVLRSSFQLTDLVADNEIDIGFVCLPIPRSTPQLMVQRIYSTEVVLVVPNTHSLAVKKKIWLKEIENFPIYMPPQQLISGFSAQVTHLFAQSGLIPNVIGVTDNTQMVCEIIARGAGAVLASRSSVMRNSPDATVLSLKDEASSLELGMIYRQDGASLPVIQSFLDVVDETRTESG